MRNKSLYQRVLLVAVLAVALCLLAACRKEKQAEEAAPPLETEIQATLEPESTAEEPTMEPQTGAGPTPSALPVVVATDMQEFVSATDLYSLMVPAGWSMEEVVPGADFVMANSAAALERYHNGSTLESGDIVLNVGFLPLALLQEKQLSHLGFQLGASPEVILQSLLPLFRMGDDPAVDAAGEAALVPLSNGKDAGMLTLSDAGYEGIILMFEAGDNVLAFVSAIAFPEKMDEYRELTYTLAAEVVFSGAQDALYAALRGG